MHCHCVGSSGGNWLLNKLQNCRNFIFRISFLLVDIQYFTVLSAASPLSSVIIRIPTLLSPLSVGLFSPSGKIDENDGGDRGQVLQHLVCVLKAHLHSHDGYQQQQQREIKQGGVWGKTGMRRGRERVKEGMDLGVRQ